MSSSVAVLGSTGSIGTQTLDVIRAEPDRYRVVALGAAKSLTDLCAQAVEFQPDVVAVASAECVTQLRSQLPSSTELLVGSDALATAATCADTVVNGVVGFAGLAVTLATLKAGKRLALANKESLIAAGPLVQSVRSTRGAELIPVDSEHCAIHQCLATNDSTSSAVTSTQGVAEVILTASGGPFFGKSREELTNVTTADALAHPTWAMGPKITIDSSTLMNKGLEVIEAHELFGVDYTNIRVVIHPQSIVHGMVSYRDGATIAQLSRPDMRSCISYALAFPDRSEWCYGEINWIDAIQLDFQRPDLDVFECLGLAYATGQAGETAPAWLSAANEVAVEAFLAGLIPWAGIADVNKAVMQEWPAQPATDIEVILDADRAARASAQAVIERTYT